MSWHPETAYAAAALADEEVVALLRQAALDAGSATEWARRHGVSGTYASDVLAGRRTPGGAILEAMGLTKVVSYLPTLLARKP